MSRGYEMDGTIEKIFEEQTFSSGFKKREFVITTQDGNFTQPVKFALIKEKCALIDSYKVGDAVRVRFDVKGRKWEDKYFVDLQAYGLAASTGSAPATSIGETNSYQKPSAPIEEIPEDDLPF